MTRDEVIKKWESLSDRERDVWVAERVMGLKADHQTQTYLVEGYDDLEGWAEGTWEPVPRYTSDSQMAWKVLETLEHGDYRLGLGYNPMQDICLAALIAVES